MDRTPVISYRRDGSFRRVMRSVVFAFKSLMFCWLAICWQVAASADEDEMSSDLAIEIEQTANRILEASTSDEIEKALLSKSTYLRRAALHRLVASAETDKLSNLFKQSKEFADASIRDELQQVSLRKLALLDPLESLGLAAEFPSHRERVFIEIVFQEWAATDLQVAIEHAQELSRLKRSAALTGIVRTRHDLPESELREIGRVLGDEQLVLEMLASSMSGMPIDDHGVALNDFVNRHGADAMLLSERQTALLSHIAESWVAQGNGIEAVGEIFSTLENDASRIFVIRNLVESIVHEQPQLAFELASVAGELSRRVGVRVMDRVMENWARMDGPRALSAATSIDDDVTRLRYQRIAVGEWATADPSSLLAMVDRLPAHLREYGHVEGLKALALTNPEAAAEALSEVSGEKAKKAIAIAVARGIAGRDLRAGVHWLQSNADPTIVDFQQTLFEIMMRETVRVGDVRLAINVALEQPDVFDVGSIIEDVADLYGSDSALSELQHISDQEVRKTAYVGIGSALIREGRSSQAIELVSEQSMEYQVSYFYGIGGQWAEYEPHDLFDKLDELPSDEIKRNLSVSLAAISASQLTKEQKEVLRKILPRTFQQMLD